MTKDQISRIAEFVTTDEDFRADILAIAASLAADYAAEYPDDPDDPDDLDSPEFDSPMLLTIGVSLDTETNLVSWGWQSGDNSYTGGAYSHPYWGVVYYVPGAEAKDYLAWIVDDLINALPW